MADPPKSQISACEIALNDYLEQVLGFPFHETGFPETNEPPRGIALIYRSNQVEPTINYDKTEAVVDLRIKLVRSDVCFTDLRLILNDWGEVLAQAIKKLNWDGVSGAYREIELVNAMRGIKLLKPYTIGAEDANQRQDILPGIVRGELRAEYVFPIERVNFDPDWMF